ncbi:CbtA family protein [Janthinobacterium sp. hw3]|uniref:CbtA family protein n=1 Tax=Janthinobacterium fluminis TaxID=2987524 RepID=A0ABT5JVL2_9BURK|nr:CbtA family protein [Janthinobacterium fluminis]MDC8756766.1 CbtA family protein [Janthinobacterium fluminis]
MVRAAAFSGILAGLLLTAVQQVQVSKIILQAETYEDAASAAPQPEHVHAAPVQHVHADGHAHTHEAAPAHAHDGAAEPAHSHDGGAAHSHAGWQPENGAERTFFTAVANISMAVGFGLLLAGAISLRGQVTGWRAGLLWGAAGYGVFFLAPSIGLPPEVPGTAAAPLAARQMWWLTTVAASAGGLALLVFARGLPLRALGAAVLFVPHLVGAPQPEVHASTAPAELARAFIYATAWANGAFWLALGALAGFFYKKSA